MEQSAAVLHSEESHKSSLAFRTISEVSHEIDVPQHVLRFWESRFTQVKPLKRGGGRRYYRPEDVALLRRIKDYLYKHGYTIKGVQRLLKEHRHGLPAAELAGLGPMGGVQEAVPDFADGYNPALHEQNEAQPQNALERGLSAITLIHDDLHLPPLPPGSTTQELEEALAEIAPPAPAETPAIIPAPAAPAAHMAPQVVVQEVMPEAARVELAALRDELMALRDMLRGQ